MLLAVVIAGVLLVLIWAPIDFLCFSRRDNLAARRSELILRVFHNLAIWSGLLFVGDGIVTAFGIGLTLVIKCAKRSHDLSDSPGEIAAGIDHADERASRRRFALTQAIRPTKTAGNLDVGPGVLISDHL